jgi:hypothetical protein
LRDSCKAGGPQSIGTGPDQSALYGKFSGI